jgi:ABC-type nitrate/sulfonate/bicarbonate transport system substrate-binding protein
VRLWMRAGGLDPDVDARLVVLPPPLMTKGLDSGLLDAFCVGAPWNSLAVEQGIGAILHLGVDLVRDCPEKVLALREDWSTAHPDETNALAGSILDASHWCGDVANLDEASRLVAEACGEPVSAAITRRILAGALIVDGSGASRVAPNYLRLDPDAVALRATDAAWLFSQMIAAGQAADTPENAALAMGVYRPAFGMDAATGDRIPKHFP